MCVYERETQSKREVQKQESVQFSSWVPKGMTFSLNILPALGRMKIRSLLDRTNKRKDRKVALGASSPPLFLLLTLKWAFSSPSPHQHPSYLSAPRHCYPRSYCLSCLLTRVWGCSILSRPLLHSSTEEVQLFWWMELPSSLLESMPPSLKADWPKKRITFPDREGLLSI